MIIIKSQDGMSIMEYRGVTISKLRRNEIVGCLSDPVATSFFLGTYESPERAIEVLEEIQNHIEINLDQKQFINDKYVGINWIHEMPKS